MFGPPEKVWSDKQETTIPGLVIADDGQGRMAYVPWDIGGLYYRHSSEAHANLLSDLIDHLLPNGRQIRTNAHPLVEMTVMDQPARHRTLVHLVNGRAIRHGVLRAHRDARHPDRVAARGPSRYGGFFRSEFAGDGRGKLPGLYSAALECV